MLGVIVSKTARKHIGGLAGGPGYRFLALRPRGLLQDVRRRGNDQFKGFILRALRCPRRRVNGARPKGKAASQIGPERPIRYRRPIVGDELECVKYRHFVRLNHAVAVGVPGLHREPVGRAAGATDAVNENLFAVSPSLDVYSITISRAVDRSLDVLQ